MGDGAMIRRRSRVATSLALAAVVLSVTACGPAGGLAPTLTPTSAPTLEPSPSGTASASVPTPSATATPTPPPTPAAPVVPPAAPRTPPTVPPLPVPAIEATEVPAVGPEPAYGSRYDYLIPCDPRIPMWFDDGDAQLSWESTDRPIECEEGQLAVIAMGVRFEEARLLTLYEDDVGMPLAYRTPTLSGFGDDAVASLSEQSGALEVDLEISCFSDPVGYIEVGDRYASCSAAYTGVRLDDVPLADALASVGIASPLERTVMLYPS